MTFIYMGRYANLGTEGGHAECFRISDGETTEVIRWCEENVAKTDYRWRVSLGHCGIDIFLAKTADAVAFRLRWE